MYKITYITKKEQSEINRLYIIVHAFFSFLIFVVVFYLFFVPFGCVHGIAGTGVGEGAGLGTEVVAAAAAGLRTEGDARRTALERETPRSRSR